MIKEFHSQEPLRSPGGQVKVQKAPDDYRREDFTLAQMMDMFPSEDTAREWFEDIIWGEIRACMKCLSTRTQTASHKYMPYWCTDCRSYFSVKTGTPMANSKIPLRKWALAIYLCLNSNNSVSSIKLHRDIGVSQPAAWFMMHRIREAWAHSDSDNDLQGPVEAGGSNPAGRDKEPGNEIRKGRADTDPGVAERSKDAMVKDHTGKQTRLKSVEQGDDHISDSSEYCEVCTHMPIEHDSINEYVKTMATSGGAESFWTALNRAHKGTFHKISPKHFNRYAHEFAAKHNMRDSETIAQMRETVARMVGRNLFYRDLVCSNGLETGHDRNS